jgi:hypothetical protein
MNQRKTKICGKTLRIRVSNTETKAHVLVFENDERNLANIRQYRVFKNQKVKQVVKSIVSF